MDKRQPAQCPQHFERPGAAFFLERLLLHRPIGRQAHYEFREPHAGPFRQVPVADPGGYQRMAVALGQRRNVVDVYRDTVGIDLVKDAVHRTDELPHMSQNSGGRFGVRYGVLV